MSEAREWKDEKTSHSHYRESTRAQRAREEEQTKICQTGELAVETFEDKLAQTAGFRQ
jgi:hypothetical protein